MENRLQKLLEIASLKLQRDKTGTWSNGSVTYFEAIYDELEEVKAEMKDGRECYLEDELGDVLWDFICMLKHLEDERKINLENVFERSVKKYSERISGIGAGESWDEIKEIQRHELAVEHEMNCKKTTNFKIKYARSLSLVQSFLCENRIDRLWVVHVFVSTYYSSSLLIMCTNVVLDGVA